MAFNVCDKNGKHIGFIKQMYFNYYDVFMIAITDYKLKDENIRIDKMKERMAADLKCKSLLGKVNEEKFKDIMKAIKNNEYHNVGDISEEGFIKYLFMHRYSELEGFIQQDEDINIKGYLLLDPSKATLENEMIFVDDTFSYIEEAVLDIPPIYAKVIDYPIVCTDIMGWGEGLILGASLADLSGRNHIHTTQLKIQSGNFIDEIELPVHINAKKGSYIQFYVENSKVTGVFCEGVIYSFK